MAATQLTPDFVQLLFPHVGRLAPEDGQTPESTKQPADLAKIVQTASKSLFKRFLVNGKRELALLALKGSILRTYLTNIGLKDFNDPQTPGEPYWSRYLRWNVYFFETDESKKKSVQKETGAIQLGRTEAAFYNDQEKDIFFALLPIDVEVNPESLSSNSSGSIQIGIRMYYDLDLSRENVFNYREADSLVSYLGQVQSKSKPKTAEHLVYIARPIDIRPCLSIHSSFTKAESEIYLRVFIRNDMRQYPPEVLVEGSLMASYLEGRPENLLTDSDLFDLYTASLSNLQLKFESSINQGSLE